MESKQRLIVVVERLQELQADLDFLHQEQVTLVNELVQLTNADPDHTPALSTEHRVGSLATANIKHTEEDATPITPQPSRVQSASYTSVNYNTSTEQLRVGEHIYIKNKISHSDRPDRIPSTTPGAEPPRDAKDSGSARPHSTHLETSSTNRS